MVPLAPHERRSIEIWLERQEERLLPAHPIRIIDLLRKLAVHWRKDRPDSDWDIILTDYTECLREFSEVQLTEAKYEHLRNSNWWPKIAELRAIAERIAAMDIEYRRRAWVLLGMQKASFTDLPETDDSGGSRDMTPVKLVAGFAR